MKRNVAIIGAGAFARQHALALRKNADFHLTGVCDLDASRLDAFATEWKSRGYKEWKELLEKEMPDIVTIATPDETHAHLIREVVAHRNAPRLIVVEKPVCVSEEELRELENLLRNAKCVVVIDHSRRFNAGFIGLCQIIQREELGMLTGGVWRYYAGWFHVGVHAVDTLRMFFGDLRCTFAEKQDVDRYENDPLLRVKLASTRYPQAEIFVEGVPEHPYKIFEADLRFSRGRIRIHWEDIAIDRVKEDSYAPALFQSESRKAEPIEKALDNLYRLAARYLNDNDTALLEVGGFATARGTMEILFEAARLARA